MTPFSRYASILALVALVNAVSWLRADDPVVSTNDAETTAPDAPAPPVTNAAPVPTEPTQAPAPSLSLQPQPPPELEAADALHLSNLSGDSGELADHLLVVYNSADPDSKTLAEYYASRRNIPEERVLGIACPLTEEITRVQYDDTIRRPILGYLTEKNWMTRQNTEVRFNGRMLQLIAATRNDIWAIVLMRGVPLKIAPDPNDTDRMEAIPGLESNAAAVDSELALLPVFGLPKGGFVPNLFFDSRGVGACRAGPDMAKSMIMVTRLDGPSPADVHRMIDDTLYAEEHRLAGLAVIDTRGLIDPKDPYTLGDIWLRNARDMLILDGWAVKFDAQPDVLPDTDPCNQVAFYLGWYCSDVRGPWNTPPDRFVRGAIAYHLHSFSASTVRNPGSNWVGPLIAHGAAATMGTVYEPSLGLTPYLDVFTKRILLGDYFAESAYASIRGLSWMVTVVGDPLYRPFREPISSMLLDASMPHTDHDDWLLLQKVQRGIVTGQLKAKASVLKDYLGAPGTGPVAEENLADLLQRLHDPKAGSDVEKLYNKAQVAYTDPIDRIRIGLKLAQFYVNQGQDSHAKAELRGLSTLYPLDAKRFGIELPLSPAKVAPLPVNPPPAMVHDSKPAELPPPKPPRPPLPPLPQQVTNPE